MDPAFLAIVVVGLGALLFMNWRMRRKQQDQLSFRDHLEEGQEVQTIGGLIGTVVDVDGDVITLETSPGTQVRFIKAALAKLRDAEQPVGEADEAGDVEDGETAEDAETSTGADDASGASEDPTRPSGFTSRNELDDIRRDDRI
ncbi:preprotein translocase subunit YajC [Ruania alkalisoli]|uniref:Preprotein translocase subunit YajC n=1 Tax=Ruania alkalisoli TaxID=2779775 RepID=A0A7M1SNE4_9MICO|nr:preprotein translocase subunit YajC [Ruania alkalisoli]QOR69079.1 preprotein translocase subunit YajC [Ruania alkalisoli]